MLPRSPIGQAIAYAQSNWAALCRYPEHGDLSIDNNLAERMLRAQALGRKNWTFLGSDRGGQRRARPGGAVHRPAAPRPGLTAPRGPGRLGQFLCRPGPGQLSSLV